MRTVADGQVAASSTAIYTATAESTVNIRLANTSAVNTETVTMTVLRSGSTARRVARFVLAPNEQGFVYGLGLSNGDIVKASSTDATTVDYLVGMCSTDIAARMFSLDANGQLKQTVATQTILPYAQFKTINVTTGTLSANDASGAAFCSLLSTNATPGSQAMRTPAQVLSDSPGLLVGSSYVLMITNTGAGTLTLATDSGSGFTMTGTMTVAQNTTRTFIVTMSTSSTGVVQSVGTGTTS